MARFLIAMFDPEEVETHHCVVHAQTDAGAVVEHPWIKSMYREEWIAEHLFVVEHKKATIDNVYNKLGWMCVCVNLDSEIMKDLNGGDLNVSSPMEQS